MSQAEPAGAQQVQKSKVVLSLGSNVAPKMPTLQSAIGEIVLRNLGRILLVSPFYKTQPWGVEDQDWYVNACLVMETELEPLALLKSLQTIENDYGRVREVKWGPRSLDLDILLFEHHDEYNHPDLKIPHPHMTAREFVLRPLADMLPWFAVEGATVQEHLTKLPSTGLIKLGTHEDPFEGIMDMYWKLSPRQITPGLDRVKSTMQGLLGEYESRLPPVIHIAGTNGKGSVAAILHKILNYAGKTVHRYTSPHLKSYNERIIIGMSEHENRFVSQREFEIAASRITPYIDKFFLSHFEALTCTALSIFADTPADFIILETGMGGRLDATNIFTRPVATAITSISYDHTEYLGDMIEAIAYEKAGIIKQGVPVVVGARDKDAQQVILDHAKEMHAAVSLLGRDWVIEKYDDADAYIIKDPNAPADAEEDDEKVVFLDILNLHGKHQLDNAGVAISLARLVLPELPCEDDMDDALSSINWPARLEQFDPLKSKINFPNDIDLTVDGCHNADGIINFILHMKQRQEQEKRPLTILFSCKNNRDLAEVFSLFADFEAEFIFMEQTYAQDQYTVEELQAVAVEYDISYKIEKTMLDVVKAIVIDPDYKSKRYAVCGSLYLCGAFFRLTQYRVEA
ncbi:MAG: 2-amino-4-hydroxy-6-hydroxymethyldihydropteridine diphosphokinase [Pseudomonadota bacterium]